MNDTELRELIDLLYPFFIKRLKEEGLFKTCIKSTNATVSWVDTTTEIVNNVNVRVSNVGKSIKVILPYDVTSIDVINKSTSELNVGDVVCLHYNIDLKNAYVAYKV